MATKTAAKTSGVKAKRTAAKKARSKAKTVVYKDERAFVKAALAKRLPRGTVVNLGDDCGFEVSVKGSFGVALSNTTENAWEILAAVMMAIGVKNVRVMP